MRPRFGKAFGFEVEVRTLKTAAFKLRLERIGAEGVVAEGAGIHRHSPQPKRLSFGRPPTGRHCHSAAIDGSVKY